MARATCIVLASVGLLGACRGLDAPGQGDAFAQCCEGLGTCIPAGLAGGDVAPRLARGECGEAMLCAPTAWVQDPDAVATACRTAGDREGRCLPSCLPEVAQRADRLQPESCGEGLLCVPCFDPLSGEDTQACRIGEDLPLEPSRPFEACCGELGRCVPGTVLAQSVPAEDSARLGADRCLDDALCVPARWLGDEGASVDVCSTLGGREGRCLSSCLPEVAAQAGELAQETCGAGELCAPCFDPLTGEDTLACRIGDDEPGAAPAPFGSCCEGTGRCVPESAVLQSIDGEDAERLATDTCAQDDLCIPETWLDEAGPRAAVCWSNGEREGRCLPRCLPEVAAQGDRLQPAGCGDAQLCVPCFDPLSGEDTGACRIGEDEPYAAPRPFEACCGGQGRCVPSDALAQSVPAEDRARLGTDRCFEDALCVPERWLGDAGVRAEVCRTLGDREGRCLASCLPGIAAQAEDLAQETCEAGELCAPCFDPLTGEDTRACRIGDDQPQDAPAVFESCCEGSGRCVPESVVLQSVSAEDAGRLAADACAQANLCVPETWLDEAGPRAAVCWSNGEREGRCLPRCLPAVAAQRDRLQPADCGDAQLCAPCFDPLSGEDTGACRIADDAPQDPPRPFENCCGGEGRCVPNDTLLQSVSAEDAARLGADACEDAALCVPEGWLGSTGPSVDPCRAAGDLEGRCLPRCLPDVAAQADRLQQRSCGEEALCVPCYDPLSGADTLACRIGADQPEEPPRPFAACCDGSGRCVPEETLLQSLSVEDRARLGAGSCAPESDALCVPERWLDTAGPRLEACRAAGDLEGRCMPSCLPAVAAQAARLQSAGCEDEQLCVPCYDPLTGADTQACRVGGDRPVDPPRPYARCCGAPGAELGTCLPVAPLSPEQLESLPVDSCSQPGTRCVPSELTETPPQLTSCESAGLFQPPAAGVCLPECFIPTPQRFFVPRGGCGAARRCAPCASVGAALPGCE